MRLSNSSARLSAVIVAVLLSLHFPTPGRMFAADEPSEKSQSLPPGAIARLGSDAFNTGSVADLAFSPDGTFIAVAEYNQPTPSATLINAESGLQRHVLMCDPRSKGSVQCLAFSPDGERLVAGDWQGTLTFFSMSKKFAIFRRKLHEGSIEDVAFSADGRFIATAGKDGKVHVLNAAMRDVVQSIAVTTPPAKDRRLGFGVGGTTGVNSVAISADGAQLVAGVGATGEVTVWNRLTGRLLRTIDPSDYDDGYTEIQGACKPRVRPVKILNDGRTLLTAGSRTVPRSATKIHLGALNVRLTRIQLWSLESGEHILNLNGPEDHGSGDMAISPDERLIAVADNGRLVIRSVEDGEVQHEFSLPGSYGDPPAWSPDGRLVAMSFLSGIEIFDVVNHVELHSDTRVPRGALRAVNWSPDGSKVFTGHSDGYLRVWNASTGGVLWLEQLAPILRRCALPSFVAITPDGRRIVAAGTRDDPVNWDGGIITAFDAVTGKRLYEHSTKQRMETAALSPDGRTIAAATSNGSIGDTHVYGIDAQTGTRRFVTPGEDVRIGLWEANQIQFSPDSSSFFVATGDSHILKYDAQTGKVVSDVSIDWRTPEQKLANRPKTPQLWEAAFSPDGEVLVSSSAEYVYVWNSNTGEKTLQIRHPHDHGCHVAISPDTRVIATSDLNYSGDPGDELVRFFDARTGEELGTFDPDGRRAYHLVFSPDGSQLFHGAYSGASLIWDTSAAGLPTE